MYIQYLWKYLPFFAFLVGIVETPDFKLFPTKEFQLRWLKIYLEEKAKAEGTVF